MISDITNLTKNFNKNDHVVILDDTDHLNNKVSSIFTEATVTKLDFRNSSVLSVPSVTHRR